MYEALRESLMLLGIFAFLVKKPALRLKKLTLNLVDLPVTTEQGPNLEFLTVRRAARRPGALRSHRAPLDASRRGAKRAIAPPPPQTEKQILIFLNITKISKKTHTMKLIFIINMFGNITHSKD